MNWQKPQPSEVWRAIEIYLPIAYANSAAPVMVKSRLDSLRQTHEDGFFETSSFERDDAASPTKLSLRLGNHFYPHMKLVIEPSPDRSISLFRADTHDRHICPALDSKEYTGFCELMEHNQKLSEAIESAWENGGLMTFKKYLREDLARRR